MPYEVIENQLDVGLTLGDDALINQYEIFFPEGIPGGGDDKRLSLRSDQSIDIPEEVYGTYEYFFRGFKIIKTNKLEETDKNITFDVRIDSQWSTYDDLKAWQDMGFDPKTGKSEPDKETRRKIGIRALGPGNEIKKTFYLNHAKLRGLKITAFDHASGDPVRVTCNFIFGYISN